MEFSLQSLTKSSSSYRWTELLEEGLGRGQPSRRPWLRRKPLVTSFISLTFSKNLTFLLVFTGSISHMTATPCHLHLRRNIFLFSRMKVASRKGQPHDLKSMSNHLRHEKKRIVAQEKAWQLSPGLSQVSPTQITMVTE